MANSVSPSKTLPMAKEELTPLITRRGFLKKIFGFAWALGLSGVFYGIYRYLAPGAGTAEPVGIPISEIPVGGSYSFQYGAIPAILLREEEDRIQAFSLICTHMACTVVWNSEKKEFYCPCHDGFFDANGNVLSGPPPAPLERLRVDVRGDKVWVGEA